MLLPISFTLIASGIFAFFLARQPQGVLLDRFPPFKPCANALLFLGRTLYTYFSLQKITQPKVSPSNLHFILENYGTS
jgi:hypothetical protein